MLLQLEPAGPADPIEPDGQEQIDHLGVRHADDLGGAERARRRGEQEVLRHGDPPQDEDASFLPELEQKYKANRTVLIRLWRVLHNGVELTRHRPNQYGDA